MSGFGLILGAAAAGGMQGAGEAGKQSLQLAQEAQQKQDLVQLQAQLEMEKDKQIAAINHDYRTSENQQLFEHSDAQAAIQRSFDAEQKGYDRANTLGVVGAQGENAKAVENIAGGYRTDAAKIGAAAEDRRTDAEKNKLTQFMGGDGLVWNYNSQTGVMTPATDQATGHQAVGLRNVPQAVLEQVHTYQEEQKTFGQTQPDRAIQAGDRITALLAPYMPNGGAPRLDPSKFPPQLQAQLPMLLAKANDPQTLANFDAAAAKYGVGGQGTGAQVVALLSGAQGKGAAPAKPDTTPPLTGDTAMPAAGTVPLPNQGAAPGGQDSPLPVGNPAQGPAALVNTAAAAPAAPVAAAPAAPAAPAAGMQTTQGTAPTTQGTAPTAAQMAARQGSPGLIVSHFVPRGPVAIPPGAGYQPDTEQHFVSRVASGASGTTKGNNY